jgi:hypothetical protein
MHDRIWLDIYTAATEAWATDLWVYKGNDCREIHLGFGDAHIQEQIFNVTRKQMLNCKDERAVASQKAVLPHFFIKCSVQCANRKKSMSAINKANRMSVQNEMQHKLDG